jgi:hypothetical protein
MVTVMGRSSTSNPSSKGFDRLSCGFSKQLVESEGGVVGRLAMCGSCVTLKVMSN